MCNTFSQGTCPNQCQDTGIAIPPPADRWHADNHYHLHDEKHIMVKNKNFFKHQKRRRKRTKRRNLKLYLCSGGYVSEWTS